MIDKSLPFYSLYLYKTDTANYPRATLPSGYTFSFYKEGDEIRWAELECSLGQFDCMEKALESFQREFIKDQDLSPEQRMIFVKNEAGEYVATATLWNGMFLGEKKQRVHWVAVSDSCAGKGIAKALLCRIMDLYSELGYSDFIYLVTGTWYYPAVGLYRKFGFAEYNGKKSPTASISDEEFQIRNEKALEILNEKLNQYESKKKGIQQ